MDDLTNNIGSKTRDELFATLYDLLLYKSSYRLSPDQLDNIVPAMNHNDYRIVFMALQILYTAAVKRGDLPANTIAFRDRLLEVLERYRGVPEHRPAVRNAIHLLGYLEDEAVTRQLEYDAPQFDDDKVRKEEYMYPVMVNVIEKFGPEIDELEIVFLKAGNGRAAGALNAIREYARDPEAHEERMKQLQDEEVEVL
jgi:hypothetical protein